MRHQSITLIMDTYGHLLPSQESDAVGRLWRVQENPPESLQATGTGDSSPNTRDGALHYAQQSRRELVRNDAKECDERRAPIAKEESPKPLPFADLSDELRHLAKGDESSGAGIRTPDTRIMIPLL